jgi:hypothetical protein
MHFGSNPMSTVGAPLAVVPLSISPVADAVRRKSGFNPAGSVKKGVAPLELTPTLVVPIASEPLLTKAL